MRGLACLCVPEVSHIYVNEAVPCNPGRVTQQKLLRSSVWTLCTFNFFRLLTIWRGRKRFVSEGDGGRIKPDGYANQQWRLHDECGIDSSTTHNLRNICAVAKTSGLHYETEPFIGIQTSCSRTVQILLCELHNVIYKRRDIIYYHSYSMCLILFDLYFVSVAKRFVSVPWYISDCIHVLISGTSFTRYFCYV